jgi:Flp pilus assembly protein TadD
MPSFFLSHSSLDKPFVNAVAAILGPERCWLDEWAMGAGDELFHEIDAAIDSAETRIFALFWSQGAEASRWVRDELANVRMRKLRREDITIIPVKLDETEMPLWMQRLLYIEAEGNAAKVASKLLSALDENRALLTSGRESPDSSFQNRTKEAQQIEYTYQDPELACAMITGFPGIGKSALCRFTLRHTLPNLNAIWVDCEAANTPAIFFATLAKRASVRLPRNVVESGRWQEYWQDWILPTFNPESDVLLIDGLGSILSPENTLPKWLQSPIEDLAVSRPNCLPVILISGRQVEGGVRLTRVSKEINIGKLTEEDVVRTLRVRLANSHPRRDASQEQLEAAAKLTAGFPLAAQLWAAYAIREGVDLALFDPTPAQRQIQAFVGDVLSKCQLTEQERRALLILSLVRLPLDVQTLTRELRITKECLHSLRKSMLLDPGVAGLAVHGLVANHISVDASTHYLAKKIHEELGEFFLRQWRSSPEGGGLSAALASQAYYHLLAAGKISEAKQVQWSFFEEAGRAIAELYRTRQDDVVIELGESLSSFDRNDDKIQFYYALALSRRGSTSIDEDKAIGILRGLVSTYPEDRYYWQGLGDCLRRRRAIEPAKEAYMRARALAKAGDATPSSKLGEIYLREGDLSSASFFLKEALQRSPNDPRLIASYASLLQRQGRQAEALDLVAKELRRRPVDVSLHHRAGLILRDMGNNIEALSHLSQATQDESLPASFISLADLYLEMGKLKDAKRVLARHPGRRSAAYYNIEGNIARRELRFTDADSCFEKCRKIEGENVFVLGSISGLRIAQAEKALEMMALPAAKAYLMQSEEAIRKGLALDSQNGALLKLKHDEEELRRQILRAEQVHRSSSGGQKS